jgi:hypothetical protein
VSSIPNLYDTFHQFQTPESGKGNLIESGLPS